MVVECSEKFERLRLEIYGWQEKLLGTLLDLKTKGNDGKQVKGVIKHNR